MNKFIYTLANILFLIALGSIVYISILTTKIKKQEIEIATSEQNMKSLTDSVRVSKNKMGELEYSKNILIGDIAVLKKYNLELTKKIKDYKGEIHELTNYTIQLEANQKTNIPTEVINYDDFRYGLKWVVDTVYNKNNSRHLSGESIFDINFNTQSITITPIKTNIYSDITNISVVQGIRDKGGNLEVFVSSDHPNFKINELNTIIINPDDHFAKRFSKTKSKRFGLGLQAGYGYNGTKFSPYFGGGINYNIIQF